MKPTSKEVIDELCKILNATPKKINREFMTPHEKAVRLVDRYLDEVINDVDENFPLETPKRLAIIAVNEIIKELTQEISPSIHGFRHNYWKEVKQEIENL